MVRNAPGRETGAPGQCQYLPGNNPENPVILSFISLKPQIRELREIRVFPSRIPVVTLNRLITASSPLGDLRNFATRSFLVTSRAVFTTYAVL
jgi:hypothetical protein